MGEVLREAAARSVIPRFQNIQDSDVEEKSPGEIVTVADKEAEIIIAAGLSAILPTARVVGEETCTVDSLTDEFFCKGEIWIIDPIDGTSNYAAGRTPFAMMAALLNNGEIVASAILDPLANSLCLAEKGAGAWIDSTRIVAQRPGYAPEKPSCIVSHFGQPVDTEEKELALVETGRHLVQTKRCAGHEYPLIATGQHQFAIYWRTLIWDHAPGILLLQEAGGKVAHLDGSPYRPRLQSAALLLAHEEEAWDEIAEMMA